jgi:hypothetical protein
MAAELLHFDHVTVVHGGDHQLGVGLGKTGAEQRSGQNRGEAEFHKGLLQGWWGR